RELLVLKPDLSFRKPRVMNIERGLAIQDDDKMIAVGGDLIAIPVIRLEGVLARGLRDADNGAGIVASRLLPPNLHLVAAGFLGGTNEYPAVRVVAAPEFDRQDEILVASIRRQVASGLAASRQGAIHDFPM